MRTIRYSFLMVLLAASMLLAACGGGAATQAPSGTSGGAAATTAPSLSAGGGAATATTAPSTAATSMPSTAATAAPAAAPTPETLPAAGATGVPAAAATGVAASGAGAANGYPGAYELKTLDVEPNASITFAGWGTSDEQQVYRDSIARFQKIYPGVKVNYTPIPSDFQTKLKAQMAGGQAPDVFYVDFQLITAFGSSGQLLALDPYMQQAGMNRSDFLPQLLGIFTVNNQTFALPKDWGTLGLMYLPEAFQQAGIPEPTANWTWDDLKKAADAINKAGKFKGFCMAPDTARFAPFVFQNGGSYTTPDFKTATLDTPEVKGAADFVNSLKTSGDLATPSDLSASWCGEALGKKLAAMTYEGGWMVSFMNQNYKDVKYAAVPLPAGPKGQADYIFTNGIGVNKSTKFPKASAALAIFLTSRYNLGQIQQTGFAYSTHPDQIPLLSNPIDKAISVGGTWPNSKSQWWGPYTGTFEDKVSKALERLFLGAQDVNAAFAQAQQEGQAALQGK